MTRRLIDWMSLEEAAKYLNVGEKTVLHWSLHCSGGFPSYALIKRKRYYDRHKIENWIFRLKYCNKLQKRKWYVNDGMGSISIDDVVKPR